MVSIQCSYISPSKWKFSSPFRNLVPYSLLTSYFYFISYLSCGDVICSTSYLCSFSCPSCGDVIYGTSTVCLVAYTIVGITCTINGNVDGSILLPIIFSTFVYVFSFSLFTLKPKASPCSTMFFFLWTFIGEFVVAFFLFSNNVCISSLILLILVSGFYEFSFWCTNIYQKIFANTKANWKVFLIPFILLDILIPLI